MTGSVEEQTLAALRYVMERYHDNNWRTLLGDLQLSFVVFLNLHCLASMEHWRDLIAMLSSLDTIDEHSEDAVPVDLFELYFHLTTILLQQLIHQ